jgi:hypothetical protein
MYYQVRKEIGLKGGFKMQPENEARLARIKKLSGILRGICKVFLVFCVIGFLAQTRSLAFSRCQTSGVVHCAYWVDFNGVEFNVSEVYGVTNRDLVTDSDRVVFGFIFALGFGAMFNCGYQLHGLLGKYSRGDVFTTESAGQIRKWGIACVLLGVFDLGLTLTPHLIANVHNGQSGGGLSLMGIGLVIMAISWIMEMAAEMREEQDLVI